MECIFFLRRTQGTDAGLKVARAGYIVGLSAASNVLAGKMYDTPVAGTMAHSFITSFEEEIAAGLKTLQKTSSMRRSKKSWVKVNRQAVDDIRPAPAGCW